jgi:hypothetical protein
MAKTKGKSFRSAATGQKVSEEFAKANPDTTVSEKRKTKASALAGAAAVETVEEIETHPVIIHAPEPISLAVGHFYELTPVAGAKIVGELIDENTLHPWRDGRPVGDVIDDVLAFEVREIDRETCYDLSNSLHADTFEVSL